MPASIKPNEGKFRELILYIAAKSADDPKFGAVKLNKLLFHADFFAYGQLGRPITGVEYAKRERGPAPRRLVPVRDAMKADGEIAIEPKYTVGWDPRYSRVVPLRKFDLSEFSADEIALVDSVIEMFKEWDGTGLSKETHEYRGWLIAPYLGATIPYEAVFLSDEPPTELEQEHALDMIKQHGWDV